MSEEKEVIHEEVVEEKKHKEHKDKHSEKIKKLEEKISELEELNKKLQNDYYKAYADAENIKRRNQQDLEVAKKYRIQSFASVKSCQIAHQPGNSVRAIWLHPRSNVNVRDWPTGF